MKQLQAEALGDALQATDNTNKRGLRSRLLSPDQINKSAQFKRWLDLFFIQRGRYKITDKAYDELGRESELEQKQRKTTELMEPQSSRENSTRTDMQRRLTKAEINEIVRRKIAKMIADQGAEQLYDKGFVDRSPHLDWKNREHRITVIKKLLEIL